jgi:hypothetical protein
MKRSTKRQRVRLVAQWRASGTSQAAFARQHHVHPRTFFDWIRACPPAPSAAARPFVPVTVVAPPAPAPTTDGLIITLPRGERLDVPTGTAPAWVAAIVAGLRAAC